MSDEDLDKILASSRRNNPTKDITGMLLYAAGAFFQVLEGPKDKVDALYDFLTEDDRHHGAIVLKSGETNERMFADWSMGFERMEEGDKDYDYFFSLSRDSIDERADSVFSDNVLGAMKGFVEGRVRAA